MRKVRVLAVGGLDRQRINGVGVVAGDRHHAAGAHRRQRQVEGRRAAHRFEHRIGTAARGQLGDERRHRAAGQVARVERPGSQARRLVQAIVDAIDRHHRPRSQPASRHDAQQADRSAADHHHGVAGTEGEPHRRTTRRSKRRRPAAAPARRPPRPPAKAQQRRRGEQHLRTRSACAPSRPKPSAVTKPNGAECTQRAVSPRRQKKQSPQAMVNGASTPVADRQVGDAGRQLFDDADELVAEDRPRPHTPVAALHDMDVGAADRRRGHPHHRVAVTREARVRAFAEHATSPISLSTIACMLVLPGHRLAISSYKRHSGAKNGGRSIPLPSSLRRPPPSDVFCT